MTPIARSSVSAARPVVLSFALVALLTACASYSSPTVSAPKLYPDDQVMSLLAERSRSLDEVAKGIDAKELQEILGVREARRISASVAGQGVSSDDDPSVGVDDENVQLPTLTASSEIGRSYREILRDNVGRDQELAAYELLYHGDADVLSDDKRVAVIRMDVSIPGYVTPNYVLGGKHFLRAHFQVSAIDDNSKVVAGQVAKAGSADGVKVYAMMPEYSAIVAQESWISSVVEDYSGGLSHLVGAVQASAAGRFARQLEETFQAVVEQPLQFAVYGKQANQCSFALGPRRRIVRRSWINPVRWFGSTYRIDYQIPPGSRSCLMMVVFPRDTKKLVVASSMNGEPAGSEAVKSNERSAFQDGATSKAKYQIVDLRKPLEGATKTTATPSVLRPAISSTLMIQTKRTVSSDTRVQVGHVGIAPSNVRVLGRFRLLVTVPADSGLQKILASAKPDKNVVDVVLTTPGAEPETVTVTLEHADKPAAKPRYSVSPAKGHAGSDVAIKHSKEDLSKVTKVYFGTQAVPATGVVWEAKSKTLIVTVPPQSGTAKPKATIVLVLKEGTKTRDVRLPSVFQY